MSYLKINVRLTKRGFLVLFIPYLTASTWYYLFSNLILGYVLKSLGTTSQSNWVSVCFNFSIVFSILIGSLFVDKVHKLRLIYTWATVMPIVSILLIFASNLASVLVLLFLLGVVFGVSLLAYCVYLCSLTNTEERGRVIGAIVSFFLLSYPVFLSLSADLLSAIITSVSLGVGTFIVLLLKPNEKAGLTTKESPSKLQSYSNRVLLFYMIPWLVFCLINRTLAYNVTTHLTHQFSNILFQAQVSAYLASSFGALVGGALADWIGRRTALSVGLVSYGIGAALSGLADTPALFILANLTSGLTWGVFLVVYVLVVWADLSSKKTCAPIYAAGLIPFYFSTGLMYTLTPGILKIPVEIAAFLSCSLIFLSNVPIIFARELLPQYITEKMYLNLHIHWIKKFLKKKSSESKN